MPSCARSAPRWPPRSRWPWWSWSDGPASTWWPGARRRACCDSASITPMRVPAHAPHLAPFPPDRRSGVPRR
ncbi:hypothetical protein DX980_33780 [Burkholderia gladioli]|nr:hypothetical protein C6V07_07915 [Burkholderia gladioli]WAG24072.1 hypothetical protein DX980_33780 [Burkholderia gladioli]